MIIQIWRSLTSASEPLGIPNELDLPIIPRVGEHIEDQTTGANYEVTDVTYAVKPGQSNEEVAVWVKVR